MEQERIPVDNNRQCTVNGKFTRLPYIPGSSQSSSISAGNTGQVRYGTPCRAARPRRTSLTPPPPLSLASLIHPQLLTPHLQHPQADMRACSPGHKVLRRLGATLENHGTGALQQRHKKSPRAVHWRREAGAWRGLRKEALPSACLPHLQMTCSLNPAHLASPTLH